MLSVVQDLLSFLLYSNAPPPVAAGIFVQQLQGGPEIAKRRVFVGLAVRGKTQGKAPIYVLRESFEASAQTDRPTHRPRDLRPTTMIA